MISTLKNIFSKGDYISYSDEVNISTKHGLFKAKIYTAKDHQYLIVKSVNYCNTNTPIIYFHIETHLCTSTQENIRYCPNPIDMILNMFRKENGVFIYYAKSQDEIEKLLASWNSKTPSSLIRNLKKNKNTIDSRIEMKEFRSLGFIFQDLNLSKIKLITSSTKVVALLEFLDIDVIKNIPILSFKYGE